jgi:hypothetical protein
LAKKASHLLSSSDHSIIIQFEGAQLGKNIQYIQVIILLLGGAKVALDTADDRVN